jgi:hypothetical protein
MSFADLCWVFVKKKIGEYVADFCGGGLDEERDGGE